MPGVWKINCFAACRKCSGMVNCIIMKKILVISATLLVLALCTAPSLPLSKEKEEIIVYHFPWKLKSRSAMDDKDLKEEQSSVFFQKDTITDECVISKVLNYINILDVYPVENQSIDVRMLIEINSSFGKRKLSVGYAKSIIKMNDKAYYSSPALIQLIETTIGKKE